jgi:membrane protease YdiL (CAAX protease family)
MSWWIDMKSRWADKQDRSRILAFIGGLPLFILVSLAGSFIGIIGYLSWWGLSGHQLDLQAGMFVLVIVSELSAFALFALPFVRNVSTLNGGVGLGVHDISKRMHTRTNKGAWFKSIGLGLGSGALLFVVAQVVANVIALIPHHSPSGDNDVMNETTKMLSSAGVDLFNGTSKYPVLAVGIVLITVLIGPFLEECLFRGLIGRSLIQSSFGQGPNGKPSKIRTAISVIVSGFIFGIAHAQFTGDTLTDTMSILAPALIGSVFTWLACRKYSSLYPTIIGHVTYNTIAMIVAVMVTV